MKFKLCLISLTPFDRVSTMPKLNIMSLASYLIKNRYLTKDQIVLLDGTCKNIVERVIQENPDLIGVSALTPFYENSIEVIKKIKTQKDIPTIIGGYHISALPETLDYPFDIGVIGEGEQVLANLIVQAKQKKILNPKILSQIPGIVFKSNGVLMQTPAQTLLSPNKIVRIDWPIFEKTHFISDYATVVIDGIAQCVKQGYIFTARGCPYQCAFCAHQVIWRGRYPVRFFPINRVADDIEYLVRITKVKALNILDDTFAVSKKRLELLIHELKRRKILGQVVFTTVFVRANLVDDEFVRLLKAFGTVSVFLGIESGSEKILHILKDGPLSPKQVKRAVELFNKYNINVVGSFMLFSPGETEQDLKKTLSLARWFSRQKNAIGLRHSVTTPYPGTKFWKLYQQQMHNKKNGHQWKNFLMYDQNDNLGAPAVNFFMNITKKRRDYYWKAVQMIAKKTDRNTRHLPNYIKMEHRTRELNELLLFKHNRGATDAWLEIKNRFKRLGKNPIRSIRKIVLQSKQWRFIITDLMLLLKK